MNKNDVVQFNESHKWCGCLGIITKVKQCGDDVKYMVGVPVPERGTAYIFVMESSKNIERIGQAVFVEEDEDDEE